MPNTTCCLLQSGNRPVASRACLDPANELTEARNRGMYSMAPVRNSKRLQQPKVSTGMRTVTTCRFPSDVQYGQAFGML